MRNFEKDFEFVYYCVWFCSFSYSNCRLFCWSCLSFSDQNWGWSWSCSYSNWGLRAWPGSTSENGVDPSLNKTEADLLPALTPKLGFLSNSLKNIDDGWTDYFMHLQMSAHLTPITDLYKPKMSYSCNPTGDHFPLCLQFL